MPIAAGRIESMRASSQGWARAGRPRAGFTIVELMVVVSIIGVMSAAVIPALGELRTDGRQSDSAHAIVHLARRTRSHAMQTGVAHLIRFRTSNDAAGSFGLGRFEVYSGMTSRCRQTPWLQPFSATTGNPLGVDAVLREGPSVLDMAKFNPTDGGVPTAFDAQRQTIAVTARGGFPVSVRAAVQICFQPGGQTYEAFSATAVGSEGTGLSPQLSPITFRVARTVGPASGGAARGVAREVVIPMGGSARVRY